MNELLADNWWLQRDGELYGPYPLATLAFILRDGRAREEDLAGPSPTGPWQPLGTLLVALPAPPPPPALAPPTPVAAPRPQGSGGLGWVLAGLVLLAALVTVPLVTVGPLYREARAKATREAAVASLEQIGLALEVYAQEHDGLLPPAGQWEAGLKTILTEDGQLGNPGGAAYVYNDSLAGQPLRQVRRTPGEVLARDPGAYGGEKLVLCANCTVKATAGQR